MTESDNEHSESDRDVVIDTTLVRRLVDTQFPEWSERDLRPVRHDGHDNRTFRLGDDMLVRLPSAAGYAAQVKKEQRWLPVLGPQLPLPIPEPLGLGKPDESFPWAWSVYGWIEGEIAARSEIQDRNAFATALAGFLRALHRVGCDGGPEAGRHNFFRGAHVGVYDGECRAAIDALRGRIDTVAASRLWESALETRWSHGSVWVHGDVSALNLLTRKGRLCGVIDFGCCGVGDPACDLTIAWTYFEGQSREAFRRAMDLDEATWMRARGWALWKALITVAGIVDANPLDPIPAERVAEHVLAEHRPP